ncbi:MAG TPA: alpha/beta hydrolase, partial [Chitinophagaceae bacterium]|nr:alpha/beta hydrolase [Chitinophagaceae bacterium]
MAHNINFNEQTGQHSFFSVKEKAWHGLGQVVQDYPTSEEAIRFAGLDYTVAKRKIYTQRN